MLAACSRYRWTKPGEVWPAEGRLWVILSICAQAQGRSGPYNAIFVPIHKPKVEKVSCMGQALAFLSRAGSFCTFLFCGPLRSARAYLCHLSLA